MRTCQSCGAENPPERDFCTCGEYLRWEQTGIVQAITPDMVEQATAQAAPLAEPAPKPAPAPPQTLPHGARVTPAAPAEPQTGNGHGNGSGQAAAPPPAAPPPTPPTPPTPPAPPSGPAVSHTAPVPAIAPQPVPPARPVARTLVRGAVPAQAPESQAHEPATIVLRLPDGDPAKGETLHQAVEPGQRDRVLALIRNQSGIVDNYDLAVEGLPADWWSIFPGTVYLVPFGSGGTYEQEVEVHLHPPRGPEAEARVWDLKVIAHSKAHNVVAASAPLALHIEPYVETATTLRPQRKKGRRKADYDVTVVNKANAPVLVALEGEDPDGELQFAFNRPPQEIPPGGGVLTEMRVRPPKQIWIGRALDRRFEAKTITGEPAAARAAAEPLAADVLAGAPVSRRKGLLRRRQAPQIPGVYGPRVYKPQLYPPDLQLGPGGVQLRLPKLQAPQLQAPQLKTPQLGQVNASQLKGKLGGGGATPSAPLLPTQGVFRQKPWIPWWAVPLLALLIVLLLLLYTLLPTNVTVPKLIGDKSSFIAEKKLVAVKLKLDPNQKQTEDAKVAPGTVIGQTPDADKTVEKGTPVTILVAVGTGKVKVPDITKKTASDADQALRAAGLTLGQASPQPIDPKGIISSQIPAPNQVVKKGTPVNIFYPDPTAADKKKKDAKNADKGGKKNPKGGAAPGGAPGAAGGGKADIVVPAFQGQEVDAYAKKAADLGIVPSTASVFDDAAPGTLTGTDPPGGTKVATGAKVKLLVSQGQPVVLYTNNEDILRLNGATTKKLDPVAAGPQTEKDPTWSPDGTHVAYTADARVMLKDLSKKDSPAIPLTPSGKEFENLAWAPTLADNVMALNDVSDADRDLCLGQITKDGLDPQCIKEPSFSIIRSIHWAPDGKSIYATGAKNPLGQTGIFGIVRWKLKPDKKAFSFDPNDWTKGHFVSDIGTVDKGVLDAALSPDGKTLAVVSNQGTATFRLWLGKPGDFLLTSAKRTAVRACKVAWRSDSQQVVVIQADAKCSEPVGSVVRLSVTDVHNQKELNAAGNDPAFQPPTGG